MLQERIPIPEGISGPELEERCAWEGAGLMVEAVHALHAGTATLHLQREEDSSYYPWPREQDFVIQTLRPARWAFNFMRGVAHWNVPFTIDVDGQRLRVREALGYTPNGRLERPFIQRGNELWVQCTPGVLHATLW